MSQEILIERFFDALVAGNRAEAREIVNETIRDRVPVERLVLDLYWPTYQMIEKLFRKDQLSVLAHHLATRLLRTFVDQAALRFERRQPVNRTVFAVCGPTDPDELGAQMAVDLLEGAGFHISFAGGGIAKDEIIAHVQSAQPDALLIFASAPSDLPDIRSMIDGFAANGACDSLQIVVGGGVFARAEGLAEEIGADLWADTPGELVEAMLTQPKRRANPAQRTVGRNKRTRSAA
ncbi:MAG: cobalamin B12-binding domain-containing protein [Phycisphaeraceae bacterium]|nr:cobalamin B12-binding domain-containing protein [Phycisphaeraceae bacterium]